VHEFIKTSVRVHHN